MRERKLINSLRSAAEKPLSNCRSRASDNLTMRSCKAEAFAGQGDRLPDRS